MGPAPSKEKIRRNDASASSFGRMSYASPSYRVNSPNYIATLKQRRLDSRQNAPENRLLIRTSSLNLGGPTVQLGERTLLMPEKRNQKIHDIGAGVDQVAPPLAQWLVLALLCALSYALYNVFIKKSSASIHPILGGVILQFVAAIMGTVLCLTLAFGPAQEEMFYDSTGVIFAVLAGAAVGIAEIVSFTVSGMGVPAVQSIPIIIGGSVMFGTVIGRIFLEEFLSPRGWCGVVMIAGGICLVGMESDAV